MVIKNYKIYSEAEPNTSARIEIEDARFSEANVVRITVAHGPDEDDRHGIDLRNEELRELHVVINDLLALSDLFPDRIGGDDEPPD